MKTTALSNGLPKPRLLEIQYHSRRMQLKPYYLNFRPIALATALLVTPPLHAQDADTVLAEVVQQQQKSLPIMLDTATRIDDITFADRTILYKMTLAGYEGRPGEQIYYQNYLTQQINNSLCSQTAYLLVLALGNKITYQYASSNAHPITEITLKPGDCKS